MIYLRSGNWVTERDDDKIVYRGYVEPSGTLDRPLDAVTCVGQGTVSLATITGTLAKELGALTAAGTGRIGPLRHNRIAELTRRDRIARMTRRDRRAEVRT